MCDLTGGGEGKLDDTVCRGGEILEVGWRRDEHSRAISDVSESRDIKRDMRIGPFCTIFCASFSAYWRALMAIAFVDGVCRMYL